MLIGITGTISSGKSTIAKYLRSKGFQVLDADTIAKVFLDNEEIIDILINRYGTGIICNGVVERQKLGMIIFNDAKERKFLNELIHPLVIAKINEYDHQGILVFVEVPLLYEAAMEDMFDKIIVIYTDNKTIISRLIKRDNISSEFALKKIQSQIDIDEKVKQADYVIDNSQDLEKTYNQIELLLRRLTK